MNATEDGTEASEAPPPRPELGAGFQWLALAGLLIGPLLGVVVGPRLVPDRPLFEARVPWQGEVPTADHWSHPPGPGESAALVAAGAAPVLATRARTPAAAEALAIELTMARLSRSPELAGRRAEGRARWSEAMLHGPSAMLSPAASCAALLRGWSMAWRAVVPPAEFSAPAGVAAGPARVPGEGAAASGSAPAVARGVRRAGRGSAAGAIPPMPEIARLALASDAAGLEGALHAEARVARGMLFARIGALPDARRVAAAEAWRGAWRMRAADLDTIATAIEARMPRIERQLIATAAPAHALAAEPAIPDPGVIALLSATLPPAAARPLWATWGVFAAAGAILACMIAVPLGWAAARARAARRAALMHQLEQETVAALAATPWTPSAAVESRLQVVTGPRPRRVASVVRELVAHFLTDGERVLVVDAGRNFRLHDSFGGRARLGFQECMRERLPLLGVVQRGGLPGLFVLAHGSASRLDSWIPLRRLLEQARPHFSRVVLALEPNVPRQAGEALAGRLIDAWWAAPNAPKAGGARRFSTRLGIPLRSYELDSPDDAPIESLVQQLRASRAPEPAVAPASAPAIAVAAVTQAPAIPPGPEPARPLAAASAAADPMSEPAIVPGAARATLEPYVEPVRSAVPEAESVTVFEIEETRHAIVEREEVAAIEEGLDAEAPVTVDSVPGPVMPPTLEATLALMNAPPDSVVEKVSAAAFSPEPPGLAPALGHEPALAFEQTPVPEEAPADALDPALPEVAPAMAPEGIAAPESGHDAAHDAAPTAPADPGDPAVLECDPEVSERLRFLVWMRRLRAKKSGETVHAP